jgi:hypothetical protein
VQRLVAHARQAAVGHAETKTVGGDRGAFHVEGDRAALAEAAVGRVPVTLREGGSFPLRLLVAAAVPVRISIFSA